MLHYRLIGHGCKSSSYRGQSYGSVLLCVSYPQGAVTSGRWSCGFDPEPVLILLEDMFWKPAGSSSNSPQVLNSRRSDSGLSEQPKSRCGSDRQHHSTVYLSDSQPGILVPQGKCIFQKAQINSINSNTNIVI